MPNQLRPAHGDHHVQLVVHIPGVRDPVRDFTDETFFPGGVNRPAQDDPAINGVIFTFLAFTDICGQR